MIRTLQLTTICFFIVTFTVAKAAEISTEMDRILGEHWQKKGIADPEPIDDYTFLRRIYLDVIGRIPNHTEATDFLANPDKNKRAHLIEQLLASEGYVHHFMGYWADVLRMKPLDATYTATPFYFDWLRDALRKNKPYDVMVRELISATGYVTDDPAIGFWFRDVGMGLDRFAIMSRTFLGTRVECAQCHDHPFDKWSQKQFYEMASFTYSVEPGLFNGGNYTALFFNGKARFGVEPRLATQMGAAINALYHPLFGNYLRPAQGAILKYPHDYQYDNAKPGEHAALGVLFGNMPGVKEPQDRPKAFAAWITDAETRRFRTVIVSRLVQRVFGRALLEPLDDLRDESVASIPVLQSHLEDQMTAMKYDMRHFLRLLLNSRAYQSAAQPMALPGAEYHFNGPLTRRLSAEQIWDSIITLVNPEPDRPNLVRLETQRMQQENIRLLADIVYRVPDEAIWNRLKIMAAWLVEGQELGLKLSAEREQARAAKDEKRVEEINAQLKARNDEKRNRVMDDVLLPLAKQRYGDAMPPASAFANLFTHCWSNWDRIDPPKDLVAASTAEAKRLGLDARESRNYLSQRRQWNMGLCRAAEGRQPDWPGSKLRNLGQSDRELVENGSTQPAIPHALDLLNDPQLIEHLSNRYAACRLGLVQAATGEGKLRALMLALLVREPTDAEKARLLPLIEQPEGLEDLILSAITTKEFLHQH